MIGERLLRRILGFGVILVGVSALSWGSVRFKKTQEARAWPTAKGQVILSEIISGSGSASREYAPNVRYRYSINGQSYESGRVSFGDYFDSAGRVARDIVNRYRPGQEVTVYYNPDKFSEAILEPGVIGGLYINLIVGFACVFVGLAGLFSRERK